MVTSLHSDALAFRETQIAVAVAALELIKEDEHSTGDASLVSDALRALRGTPGRQVLPDDVGRRAQEAAEAHLNACQEAQFAQDEGDETVESPAYGPFCGCDTCIVRETLWAAWPVFEADVQVGADVNTSA